MVEVPDHPEIRNAELTGYASGREPQWPVCPVCGRETDTFYRDKYGDTVGCSDCVKTVDAWDCLEE